MTSMPPWYQPCTYRSRPGTGMRPPLWATQFSSADWAAGSLKYERCVTFLLSALSVRIVLPPISIIELAWHIGDVPPPHSLVTMSFLPSLLNPAVCRPWKLLVSDSAAIRNGFSGFEISTRMPYALHAARRRCFSGYAVTSWQLRGPVRSAAAWSAAAARPAADVSAGAPPRPPRPRPPPPAVAGAQKVRQSGPGSKPVKMRAPGITLAFS